MAALNYFFFLVHLDREYWTNLFIEIIMDIFNIFFKFILTLAILMAAIFIFREPLSDLWQEFSYRYRPCQEPIAYSIGNFDEKFGMSEDDFLQAVQQAEQIWEVPIKKDLFTHADKGDLVINLNYDYRQEATEKLQDLGITIHDDEKTYNTLKAKYDSLQKEYKQQKADLDSMISAYQAEKRSYEAEVARWNSRGGAPKPEYDKLENERNRLNAQVDEINQAQRDLNDLVDTLNATGAVLNRLASSLNLGVAKYNTVGAELGGEFQEGEYVGVAGSGQINIYQFDDRGKLIRVLAHELGHALGIGHLEDPKAIMYKLNEGINEKLTTDDISALKDLCGIE